MELCKKEECLSCCACYAVCPMNAIQMEEDALGKRVPVIDAERCIRCGLCRKACPQIHPVAKAYPIQCLAAYSTQSDDRKKSASGGIAALLGRKTLEKNGAVFSPSYQNKVLVYGKAETEEELEKFRGSKYVHSFPDTIYADVKKELAAGRECTFIGLPCQVAGLKSFLGKDRENLLTVDVICHGAPPFRYLEEHVNHLGIYESYDSVSFRGEKNFYLTVRDKENRILYSKKQQEDPYFEAFMNRLTFRDCCYTCPYACNERVSDITVGDFWGLADDALGHYSGRISCILINTEKGEKAVEQISGQMTWEKRTPEEAFAGNDQLREPSIPHSRRQDFAENYKQGGFYSGLEKSGLLHRVRQLTIRNRVLYIPRWIKRTLKKKRAMT